MFVVQNYVSKRASAMYNSFLKFINEHQLIQPTDRVVLAVSGGLDSVVMTHLFFRAGFAFGIAHVNFGLRGAESDADEQLVRELAEQFDVPFHSVQFDTDRLAAEQRKSIQVLARELRYAWFDEVAREQGYSLIATAHHQNDVLETLLLNLARGTGLTGLRSIPVRQGNIIRPMWGLSRMAIKDYAVDGDLTWRDDRSNDEDKYNRNKIRHHIVPVLEKLNPNLLQTLAHTLERLRAADSLVDESVRVSGQACVRQEGLFWNIDLDKLHRESEWAFRLSEWLKPFGFSYAQSREVAQVVGKPDRGQVFRSSTHGVWHDRNGLVVAPLVVELDFTLPLPDPQAGTLTLPDGRQFVWQTYDRPPNLTLHTDPTVALLDADQLTGPLRIRRWQEGDRFQPLNMTGHKLVSNLLNDRKVSLPERSRTAVFESAEGIAWVVGHRLAHSARVTDETRRVFECRLE